MVFKFLLDQYTVLPIVKEDLAGKTVIVTGANAGLGLEAARHFASMNPGRLILACRSQERGDAAVRDIIASTSCSNVECWKLDQEDFISVKAFSDRFYMEGGGKLDILVENAGVATRKYAKTQDGWEQMLHVNHLSTALLGILLLPALLKTAKAGPTPRMVVISSQAHRWVKVLNEGEKESILQRLTDEEYCTPEVMKDRYPVSKLLNVFWARALAARLIPGSNLTVNAVGPGFCRSEIIRGYTYILRLAVTAVQLILARTSEMGSRTYLHAALGGTRDEMHGKFLSNCRDEGLGEYVTSPEGEKMEARLWAETLEVLKGVEPSVEEIAHKYLCQA